ncbi:MAG: glutamine synthetase III [Spirochaetales bacterium]|nr:glutamine synthetase III [Spirochaetales bacterium]
MSIDFVANPVEEIYGESCFNDATMKARLPKNIYKGLKAVQAGDSELTMEIAEVVASAMKDWAIEKGATHYTHWFHPLTGLTAEKHDSFISPSGDGTVIMEFSGKELTQGEPDASSFPNGGLRATFEARGYTAWDVNSPAFLKQDNSGLTLCIPTGFVSYTGEALDKKVPLLRSMDALNKQAMRILKIMGNTTSTKVTSSVGPEQEYFLVDKELYLQRSDLRLTGRALFGTMSAKGQEMDDHYFGAIKERVADFMRELNYELWRLGISAKTQHNEVAPNQFEIAPIFSSSNVATDSNQLVMEMLQKVADRHDLVCLLHEKPFAGVNGNGKHNNWSMATDDGINLLNPGDTPQDNAQFMLVLSAIIKAVDVYAPLLKMSASSASNDHRLGANEAPPAIISIFLGSQLKEILDCIAAGKPVPALDGAKIELGASHLPKLPKDNTDRNRTSPFAFTGNRFEFRMVGSSQSLGGPNVVINTSVAEILCEFADKLEKASDVNAEIQKIVKETYKAHDRIIFNGNGYSDEWVAEAEKRGLPNLKNTVVSIPELISDSSVALFEKHKVFTKGELESRYEVYLEDYCMRLNIEAGVTTEMAERLIFPAVSGYTSELASSIADQKALGLKVPVQEAQVKALSEGMEALLTAVAELKTANAKALAVEEDSLKAATSFLEDVIPAMGKVRAVADGLEKITDKFSWPFPSYEDLLFTM